MNVFELALPTRLDLSRPAPAPAAPPAAVAAPALPPEAFRIPQYGHLHSTMGAFGAQASTRWQPPADYASAGLRGAQIGQPVGGGRAAADDEDESSHAWHSIGAMHSTISSFASSRITSAPVRCSAGPGQLGQP